MPEETLLAFDAHGRVERTSRPVRDRPIRSAGVLAPAPRKKRPAVDCRSVPAQKPILHKNLSGLGIGLPMKIATDDFGLVE